MYQLPFQNRKKSQGELEKLITPAIINPKILL